MKISCADDANSEFEVANDSEVVVSGVELHRAQLQYRDLDQARFENSNLRGSNFAWASLKSVEFKDCNLATCVFYHANLRGADFSSGLLSGASFEHATLIGASFGGADIAHCSFRHANLIGTKMFVDRIDSADFQGAIFDDSTLWPDGFVPEDNGLIRVTDRRG